MKNFSKIFDLIKKTGDRFIIENNKGELFVIMDLKKYEDLVFKNSDVRSLNKDELINKINKDISIWKSEQDENQENFFPSSDEAKATGEAALFDEGNRFEEDKYYFEPEEDAF
jgi:hypothetical protein